MINGNRQKYQSIINFFVLFLFVFFRTLVLIPEGHFGLSISKLQLELSFESVLLIVLLIVYSLLFSAVVNKIYCKSAEVVLPVIVLILFDCVFFTLMDDCLKLIVAILGLLCVLNALSKRKIVKNSVSFPLFVLLSTVLDPRFVFSFVSLAFIIYLMCNASKKSKQKNKTLLISFICVIVGVSVNLIFTKNVEAVESALNALSFLGKVPTNKSWKTFMSFLPTMIVGYFLYDNILKANKKVQSKEKRKNIIFSADLMGIGYMFSFVGFLFFESEAFITINMIVPIILIVCVLKDESVVVNQILKTVEKINKNKIIVIFISIVVFYWCFGIMDDFNIGEKIIDYMRY